MEYVFKTPPERCLEYVAARNYLLILRLANCCLLLRMGTIAYKIDNVKGSRRKKEHL